MRVKALLALSVGYLSLLSLPGQVGSDSSFRADAAAFRTLDNGLRWRPQHLPGSLHECLALVLEIGRDHDPEGFTGFAEVVGSALVIAQEDIPERRRFQVVVKDAFTLLWTIAPRGEVDGRLDFLRDLLRGELPMSADLLDRARARAALAADDASMVFPGPILRQRAQRALWSGTPKGRQSIGIPTEIEALTLEQIRRRISDLYRPRVGILVALGGMEEAELSTRIARLTTLPPGVPPPAPAVYDPLPPPEDVTTHDRVDGPFVSAGLRAPAPDSPEFPPFLLAMEILRSRSVMAFRAYRGGESWALFPFFVYSYMDGERIAMLNRRGENHNSSDDVKAEMGPFLRLLRSDGVRPEEVSSAASAVVPLLSLPPYERRLASAMVAQEELLLPRALALCMYELWGWPTDLSESIRSVAPAAVQRVLEESCAPDQLRWFALVPSTDGT